MVFLITRYDSGADFEVYAFSAACYSLSVSFWQAEDVWSSNLCLPLQAMYPTVVIVLVETQRSVTDICEI